MSDYKDRISSDKIKKNKKEDNKHKSISRSNSKSRSKSRTKSRSNTPSKNRKRSDSDEYIKNYFFSSVEGIVTGLSLMIYNIPFNYTY